MYTKVTYLRVGGSKGLIWVEDCREVFKGRVPIQSDIKDDDLMVEYLLGSYPEEFTFPESEPTQEDVEAKYPKGTTPWGDLDD